MMNLFPDYALKMLEDTDSTELLTNTYLKELLKC